MDIEEIEKKFDFLTPLEKKNLLLLEDDISEDFLRIHEKDWSKSQWYDISNRKLSIDFIREFKDKLDINTILYNMRKGHLQ